MKLDPWGGASRNIGPVAFVPIAAFIRQTKTSYEWDPLTEQHLLHKNDRYLSFRVDDPYITLNGSSKRISLPARFVGGEILLSSDFTSTRWWEGEVPMHQVNRGIRSIIIDAGHGGKDNGANGAFGLKEKRVTLEISQKLAQRLRALGYDVMLTREGDEFIALPERAWIANNSGADLFISIHANAARSQLAKGMEVYSAPDLISNTLPAVAGSGGRSVYPTAERHSFASSQNLLAGESVGRLISTAHRRESAELAREINSSVAQIPTIHDRGVKRAEFFVLKWIDKPSVLVEVGFLTNPDEAKRLQHSTYQDILAQMIAQGISAYSAKNV